VQSILSIVHISNIFVLLKILLQTANNFHVAKHLRIWAYCATAISIYWTAQLDKSQQCEQAHTNHNIPPLVMAQTSKED